MSELQHFEALAHEFDHERALELLLELSHKLSTENNTTMLLEEILISAKLLTQADGGTIYSKTEDNHLKFGTLFNDKLGMYMGGTSGNEIPFDAIPIYIDEEPNYNALAALCAATDTVINIEDAYKVTNYDMSAARNMDQKTGYRTKSVLTVPMKNHEDTLIGVLQLINAQNEGNIVAFGAEQVELIISMASLAAVAMTNRQLIDDMEALFQSFAKLIAKAIDEKSPYTGGHCRRVPELTMMLADATNQTDTGPLADFTMSDEEKHALNIAGWLHDCGKVATPEYVMDKSNKLETIFDRIDFVDSKFEIAKRDLEIDYLKKLASAPKQQTTIEKHYAEQLQQLEQAREFIRKTNTGCEFMSEDDQQKVVDISEKYAITVGDTRQALLTENEIENLQIARGTLTGKERDIINHHIDITIEMLESLPFPKHLKQVPEYAGGHHERIDGKGYPKGLTRDEMSWPARMMAIADVFEALTASDRPYKPAKKLSECINIMNKMTEQGHLDPDLYQIFIEHKIYLKYAEQFLDPSQIDDF